jgi:uncharacterized RDD family membrane protein YckC
MTDIQCRYCHTVNDGEERRCARCGRRLHLSAPRSAPDPYPSAASMMAATAPAFETFPGGAPVPENRTETAPRPTERPSYQPSLFSGSATGSSKVIPIPTLTPLRPETGDGARSRRSGNRSANRSGARKNPNLQQPLEFHDPSRQGLPMQMDVIICDAPVAIPAHRMIAAAVDASAILLALGLFLGIFYLGGGQMVLNKQTVPFLLGVGLVIGIFYRFVWVHANCDTPGMRFAGLKLVDFDGREPTREQRGVRQAAGLLSLLSAGLGLLWAMVDEENLTWHDHISKTFPTPSA